jgi:hypothetical protein
MALRKSFTGVGTMKVLFDRRYKPLAPNCIGKSIKGFGHGYNEVVRQVIENSGKRLDERIFHENVATLMPNFKMTRQGPFKGVKIVGRSVKDPEGIIAACWKEVGKNATALRRFLDSQNKGRIRVIVEVPRQVREEIAKELWNMFKKIVPLCMGEYTYGLVGASKVLFAVLPEVAQPIDNSQWLNVFRTIDYGDIIKDMAEEIERWEKLTGRSLNDCSPYESLTLPAIYNVMAMKARPSR